MTQTVEELIGCSCVAYNLCIILSYHRKLNLGIYNSIYTLNAVSARNIDILIVATLNIVKILAATSSTILLQHKYQYGISFQ